jgi:uncharacterized damage-inducible protein DinB
MTPADLRLLVDYHYWARDRVLDAAAALTPEQYSRDLASSFRSVRETLVHLYSADWVWCERWHGASPTAHVADRFPDVDSLRRTWSEHETKLRTFIDAVGEDINRRYDYKLFNGSPGSSPLWQMVQHVVNHGSYHRGQVTTMLRQLGAAPGKSMDLIAYYRAQGSNLKA